MTKRKTAVHKPTPEITLREHAALAAREWLTDFQLRLQSQLDALLERVGLVRKSQV